MINNVEIVCAMKSSYYDDQLLSWSSAELRWSRSVGGLVMGTTCGAKSVGVVDRWRHVLVLVLPPQHHAAATAFIIFIFASPLDRPARDDGLRALEGDLSSCGRVKQVPAEIPPDVAAFVVVFFDSRYGVTLIDARLEHVQAFRYTLCPRKLYRLVFCQIWPIPVTFGRDIV